MASVVSIIANIGHAIYNRKPTSQQAKKIQAETAKPEKIGLEDLADLLGHGCSFRPCAINGTHDDGFISQQLFCVDVDNVKDILMPSDAVRLADREGLPINFGYHTFSSTKEKPKYRLCFLLDRPITDRRQRDAIQQRFIDLFGQWADHKCGNPARIFYGGNQGLFYSDFKAVIRAESILPKEITATEEKAILKPSEAFIQAVRQHDSGSIRSKFGYKETRYFDNRDAFFSWLYRGLDLSKLLGVMPGTSFHCVLHADRNPSASVFRSKNSGYWLYKCFSDSCPYGGMVLTVKGLIEAIGGFKSEYQALLFIKQAFNVDITVSAWSSEQQANIDLMMQCLSGLGGESSFNTLCPTAGNNIRNCKNLFLQILVIAKSTIFPERMPKSGQNVVFYMSVRQLSGVSNKNMKRTGQYLKLLAYHHLIDILPDSEVPKRFLKSAIQGQGNRYNHTQFYMIPSFVSEKLKEIELRGISWQEHGYRVAGISYECFYRAEGAELARKLYPQTATTTKQGKLIDRQPDDRLHMKVSEILLELIQGQGYATERQIVQAFPSDQQDRAMLQIKRSMSEICQTYNLNRHKCNRQEKELYQIQGNGYPVIITK